MSKEIWKDTKDIKVIPSEGLESDHRLLIADLHLKNIGRLQENCLSRIKIWKLKDKEFRDKFAEQIKRSVPKDEIQSAQKEWEQGILSSSLSVWEKYFIDGRSHSHSIITCRYFRIYQLEIVYIINLFKKIVWNLLLPYLHSQKKIKKYIENYKDNFFKNYFRTT